MVDIKNKRCASCVFNTANRKYAPNCASCHFALNPDDPRVRNHKTKENAIMQSLVSLYPSMVLDKIITGGCSKRRPDGLLDCLSHSIIIEVDENEHRSYDSTCEKARLHSLFEDLGDRPLVIIRVNPDAYTIGGKRYPSDFRLTKGSSALRCNKSDLSRRIKQVVELIDKHMNTVPEDMLTIDYVCFSD